MPFAPCCRMANKERTRWGSRRERSRGGGGGRQRGGRRPERPQLEAEVGALIADDGVGELLVAEEGGELVGVLGASWQRAIHVPGRYATIQDLWVHPDWRSRGIGAELVAALAAAAR